MQMFSLGKNMWHRIFASDITENAPALIFDIDLPCCTSFYLRRFSKNPEKLYGKKIFVKEFCTSTEKKYL